MWEFISYVGSSNVICDKRLSLYVYVEWMRERYLSNKVYF